MTMRPSIHNVRLFLAALVFMAVAGPAIAGACSVSSSGLAFGAYQPLTFAGKLVSADKTSDGAVSVVCTGIVTGGSYSISLGPSATGNSISPRYLDRIGGDSAMVYNIYRDASLTSIWGDGVTGSMLAGSLPVGDSNHTHTVYGRIPAGQSSLRSGNYSGSLTMTITYEP